MEQQNRYQLALGTESAPLSLKQDVIAPDHFQRRQQSGSLEYALAGNGKTSTTNKHSEAVDGWRVRTGFNVLDRGQLQYVEYVHKSR